MNALKGVVGLGGKSEEGQEPVSGAKGEGTTAEPYDSGNKQEATQAADQTKDASEFDREHSYLSSAIDADQERAADASKSDQPPPASSTAAAPAEEPPAAEEKSRGGGFLKSFGFGGGKKEKEETDEKAAAAGAEKTADDKAEAEKDLPPNHLGSAVPAGASTDLADPGTVAPGQTDGVASQKDTSSGAGGAAVVEPPKEDTTPRSPSTSAGKQPDRGGSVESGLSPERATSTGGGATALPGSRGEHRGSMIPPDAPKYKRVENPDRIPTAGGKRIGEEQYQTRRASIAPSSSPPPDMKKLDREGSPDPVTAENTAANTQPGAAAAAPTAAPATAPGATEAKPHVEGKNTAPQQMKEFSMGDASKEAEAKPTTSDPMAEDVAPDAGPKVGNAMAPEKAVSPSASASPPAAGKDGKAEGHTRRGSMFGKLKEKMKGHKGEKK